MAYKLVVIVFSMMMYVFVFGLPLNEEIMSMDHVVGDDKGWSIGVDFAAWVQSQQFHVGDKLVFQYQIGDHNVIEVDEAGYRNCVAPSTAAVLESGKDTITLSAPGTKWFICGVSIHCSTANQKLEINVLSAGSPPADSTTTSSYSSANARAVVFNSCSVFLSTLMLLVILCVVM